MQHFVALQHELTLSKKAANKMKEEELMQYAHNVHDNLKILCSAIVYRWCLIKENTDVCVSKSPHVTLGHNLQLHACVYWMLSTVICCKQHAPTCVILDLKSIIGIF